MTARVRQASAGGCCQHLVKDSPVADRGTLRGWLGAWRGEHYFWDGRVTLLPYLRAYWYIGLLKPAVQACWRQ